MGTIDPKSTPPTFRSQFALTTRPATQYSVVSIRSMYDPARLSDRGAGRLPIIQVKFDRASVERHEGIAPTETPLISYDFLNIVLTVKR